MILKLEKLIRTSASARSLSPHRRRVSSAYAMMVDRPRKEKAATDGGRGQPSFFYQSVFRNRASVTPTFSILKHLDLSVGPSVFPSVRRSVGRRALISLSRRSRPRHAASIHFRRRGRWKEVRKEGGSADGRDGREGGNCDEQTLAAEAFVPASTAAPLPRD